MCCVIYEIQGRAYSVQVAVDSTGEKSTHQLKLGNDAGNFESVYRRGLADDGV
jgi:hypothetical protein